jgi:hypothetical protein
MMVIPSPANDKMRACKGQHNSVLFDAKRPIASQAKDEEFGAREE